MGGFLPGLGLTIVLIIIIITFGLVFMFSRFYRKVEQGKVVVRNGVGGQKVSFSGIIVLPIVHRFEIMDISVKRVEIAREGKDGLVCKDNMRADIRVVFFVRVNLTKDDVLKVAQLLGCKKASDSNILNEFFDAKFSEALKTAGKQFDFVQLYTNRETFKNEILQVIGTDLNGYILDDAAIDYLEQTDINKMNNQNILDAEGIKKITELTSEQLILANQIERNKEKVIKQQDVAAKEAILELEKQKAQAEARQKREIDIIRAKEMAEAKKVMEEERLKSESAKIKTDEEIAVSEENKLRQIIIAIKQKESTEAVENERVEKRKLLERTEKEKVVELADIAKTKVVEEEKKLIQDVIRERIAVEKDVVVEEEKIKDTRASALAEREKAIAIKNAEKKAEESLIKDVKESEAKKLSAEKEAEKLIIETEAKLKAAEKESESRKIIADAIAEEESVKGMAEARVIEVRADALEKEGNIKAKVLRLTSEAEAMSIKAKAKAEAEGEEAKVIVLSQKYKAEADGIELKAKGMKALDEAGRDHEEFKLRLYKEKEVQLAEFDVNKDIAKAQASVIGEALKSAKIDIVGGETKFFDKIVNSITKGKSIDRIVDNSKVISDVKDTFINGDSDYFKEQLKNFVSNFNLTTEDLKNLTISGAIYKMMGMADKSEKSILNSILDFTEKSGIANKSVKLALGEEFKQ
jgi:uncharacterized membrane protein YqiK